MSVFRCFEFITESLDVHFICNLQESTRVDSWRLQKNGERSNRGLFACGFFRVATELGRTDAEVLTEAVGKVGAAAESTF